MNGRDYDITYMWNLKKKRYKWTYLQNRNRLTDIENKLMVTKGKGRAGDKLGGLYILYIKYILYIHKTEPLCYIPETNITL